MEKPIEILNYLDNREFIIARSLLEKEGIDNFYTTHGPSDIDGSGNYYKIFVEEKDYQKAEIIGNKLKSMIKNEENEMFSFCPKCDFNEIDIKKLNMIKSVLLNSKIECICKKCGHKWYARSINY
jgi:hypothetical protein